MPTPEAEAIRSALAAARPEDAFDLLLADAGGTANSRKAVRSGWRVFQRYLDGCGASLLGEVDAEHYQRWLSREYRGVVSTVNNRLTQARRLCALLVDLGVRDDNPFTACVGAHNPAEVRRRAYATPEVEALAAQSGPEDRVLILLGAHAGLTGPEARALAWADVHPGDGRDGGTVIRVPPRGARAGRAVPCSPDLSGALEVLAQARGDTPLLGAAPRGVILRGEGGEVLTEEALRARVYRCCERAGVPYRAWQALRHHAAQRFLAVHARPQVMALLGVGSLTALLPTIRMTASPDPADP